MLIFRSYAKINLFLDIIGIYKNGYHKLRSVFSQISLHDLINYELTGRKSPGFYMNNKSLPDDNLLNRAGYAFLEKSGVLNCGIDFYLEKKIPAGGGLGGGSSNAAAVLRILNNICKTNYSRKKLEQIGAGIGADVPFFIKGGIQKVCGIGEITKSIITNKCDLNILLLFPETGVSTKKAYKLIDDNNLYNDNYFNKKKFNNIVEAVSNNDYPGIIKNIYNRFQDIIFQEYPVLKENYEFFYSLNPDIVFMTGSGSTLVGIFPDSNKLKLAYEKLKNSGYSAVKTSIISYT